MNNRFSVRTGAKFQTFVRASCSLLATASIVLSGVWATPALAGRPTHPGLLPQLRDFALSPDVVPVGQQIPPRAGSSQNVTFGIGPVIVKSGQPRSFFNFSMTAGAQSNDAAEVLNYSQAPLTLSVYPTDVVNDPDGTTSFPSGSARRKDAGAWLSLAVPGSTDAITVPARNGVVIPFKVVVPHNAQPGDHEAGIIVSLSTFAKNKQGDTVRLDQRVAARAFFRVSGKLKADVVIQKLGGAYHQNFNPLGKGSVTVSYRIRNLGNVRVNVKQTLAFKALLAHSQTAKGLPQLNDFLPGGSDSVSVRFRNVPPELLGRATVRLALSPPLGVSDPRLQPVVASDTIFLIPLVLLLIILALVLLWLYRRRRRKSPAAGAGPPPAGHDAVPASVGLSSERGAETGTVNKAGP